MAMLRFLFSICFMSIVYGNVYNIPLGEDITHATVYASRVAELHRYVRIVDSFPAGFHDIVIENFPYSAQDDSLRIMVNETVEILDLKWNIMEQKRDEAKELELKAKIKSSQEKKSKIMLDKALYDMKKNYMESKMKAMNSYLSTQMTNSASYGNKPLTAAEIVSTLNFTDSIVDELHQEHVEIQSKTLTLASDEAEVDEELKKAEAELLVVTTTSSTMNKRNSPPTDVDKPVNTKQLVLHIRNRETIEKKADYPVVFNLRYFASPASWQPNYDIRIDNVDNKESEAGKGGNGKKYQMLIDYSAYLSQQTNEDWQNVLLTLSTSSPQYIDMLPQPERRTVQIQQANYYHKANHRMQAKRARGNLQPLMAQDSAEMFVAGGVAMEDANAGFATAAGVAPMMMKSARMAEPESQAQHSANGDLQSTHLFDILHRVNVSSIPMNNKRLNSLPSAYHSFVYAPSSLLDRQKILMDKLSMEVSIFSFAVPSQGKELFLTAFGTYPLNFPPLLPCSQVKLDIHGTYIGTLTMPGYKPGQQFQTNLGHDSNILLSTYDVIPMKQGHEEDKSTWFVTDKKKFLRRFEEKMMTVKSLYLTGRHFVLLSENIPSSLETAEDIKVELLSPAPKECKTFDNKANNDLGKNVRDSSTGKVEGGMLQEEDFVLEILSQEMVAPKPITSPVAAAAAAMKSEMHCYYSKANNNVYWGIWLSAGDTMRLSYKYQITWPEEKQIVIDTM